MVLDYLYNGPLGQSELINHKWVKWCYSFDLVLAKLPTEMTPNDPILLAITIQKLSKWFLMVIGKMMQNYSPDLFLAKVPAEMTPMTPYCLLQQSRNYLNGFKISIHLTSLTGSNMYQSMELIQKLNQCCTVYLKGLFLVHYFSSYTSMILIDA